MDVLAISPIFYKDELIGFTAIKQHWVDLGQKKPAICWIPPMSSRKA